MNRKERTRLEMAYNTKEMIIYTKTKDLIDYTFNITESKKFPKKSRFVYVNRLQNITLDIYSKLLKVNETPNNERKNILIDVICDTKTVMFLIEECLKRKYINFHTCQVWTTQCMNVKNLSAAWLKKYK